MGRNILTNMLRAIPTARGLFRVSPVATSSRAFAAGPTGSPKRFYDRVTVSDEAPFNVLLDGRAARTTMKSPIVVPSQIVATAMAAEWDMIGDKKEIILKRMPLTTLACVALDQVRTSRVQMITQILGYLQTDTVCYRVENPEDLLAQQQAQWDPLVEWFGSRFGAALEVTTGLFTAAPPELALNNVRAYLEGLCEWKLAAMFLCTSSTKSLVISLALAEKQVDSAAAFKAARVEETYQTDAWGIVEGGHDWDIVSTEVVVAKTAFVFHVL